MTVMTVAITGANGFIGSRLVEMLTTAPSPRTIRVLTRRRSGTQNARVVDLTDPEAVKAAVLGCQAVIHCAFDFQDMDANLRISSAIASACAAAGARLVHVSSAAVYEPFPDGPLDETSGTGRMGSDYAEVKSAIETELLGRAETTGLDVVIIQPTVVYGPNGRAWTDSPVRELLTGTVVLPDNGDGLCNAVYIDDVCQAVIAALTAPVSSGERFLISGGHPVTWKAFYSAYQNMLGLNAITLSAETERVAPGETPSPGRSAPGVLSRIKATVTKAVGAQTVSKVNMAISFLRCMVLGGKTHVATGAKLALFRSRCDVRIDKARRLLGYVPAYDLDRGMQAVSPYIQRTYAQMARLRAKRR